MIGELMAIVIFIDKSVPKLTFLMVKKYVEKEAFKSHTEFNPDEFICIRGDSTRLSKTTLNSDKYFYYLNVLRKVKKIINLHSK